MNYIQQLGINLTYSDMVGQPRIQVRPPTSSQSASGWVGGTAALAISYGVGGAMLLNPKTAPIGTNQ